MQNIKFKIEERNEYTIVSFELENNITPDILPSLKPPVVNWQKGVVLSGRGPIWLYCFLTHFYHPSRFIAVFDPRLGAVVVQSHHPEKKVGEIIK